MTYQEFTRLIQTTQLDKQTYYSYLVTFSEEILLDVQRTNQLAVAQKLGISQTKLSILLNILSLPNLTLASEANAAN